MGRYVKCLVIKFVDKFQRSLWMPSEGIRCAWLPRKERESRNKIGLASNRKTDDQQKIQMAVHIVSYPRYSTTDHWIQESINELSILGCFGQSGLQRRKKIQTTISMQLLRSIFYVFMVKTY